MKKSFSQEIIEAKNKINNYIMHIPLYYDQYLSDTFNAKIYLKLENLQRTGSFKIRGALNCIIKNLDKCKSGIVTASAGNHAQGIALGTKLLGLKATIVMPTKTPLVKINNTKNYGANIILYGENYNESSIYAQKIAKNEKAYYIHPFNDEDVIAGQGTIAFEIFNELPETDYVIVPIGGGGLISGISMYIKEIKPTIKVIGVQAENTASMYYSLQKNCIVTVPNRKSIADGISVHTVENLTLELCKKYVDEIYLVKENDIARAILYLIEKSKLVVEGAGAVTLACLLTGKLNIGNKTIVLILSGGNIDVNLISRIINKGLASTGRFAQISIILDDTPGALNKITGILAENEANILDLKHYRYDINLEVGQTKVSFDLETKGFLHIQTLINNINKYGYEVFINE